MLRQYLSLDPSLRSTGWAIIQVAEGRPSVVAGGFIDTRKADNPLRVIRSELLRITSLYSIERDVPKERLFWQHNIATQQLAKVHGVIEEALADYNLVDMPSGATRKKIGGHRQAKKTEVANGVRRILGLPADYVFERHDVSDAIAIGLHFLADAGMISLAG